MKRFNHKFIMSASLMILLIGLLIACENNANQATLVPSATLTAIPPTSILSIPTITVVAPTAIPPTSTSSISMPINGQVCPDMEAVMPHVLEQCSALVDGVCHGRATVTMENVNGDSIGGNPGTIRSLAETTFIEQSPAVNGQPPGIALMQHHFDGSDKVTRFVIFGNTQVRNEIGTNSGLSQRHPFTATIGTTGANANMRQSPSQNATRLDVIPNNSLVSIYDISIDGQWLLVRYVDADNIVYGWVNASVLSINGDPSTLANQGWVSDEPWQFMSIRGDSALPSCDKVPASGLLIQSPEGNVLTFKINGVLVYMSSTVLVRPLADGGLRIINLEGHIAVQDKAHLVVNIAVGFYVDIDANGRITQTTVTTVQINYADGVGLQIFTTLINIRLDVVFHSILLPKAVDVEDVWACAANDGTLTTVSDAWLIFKVYSTSNHNYAQIQAFHASNQLLDSFVTIAGIHGEFVGRSSIIQNGPDWYSCEPTYIEGLLTECRNLTRGETSNPYYVPQPNWYFIDYYAIPPLVAGSYSGTREDGRAVCPINVKPSQPQTITIIYDSRNMWQNTGIYLRAGQKISISASDTVEVNTSDGVVEMVMTASGTSQICPSGAALPNEPCALNGVPFARLVGQVGAYVFDIGSSGSFVIPNAGTLELSANDYLAYYYDNVGSYKVDITINP